MEIGNQKYTDWLDEVRKIGGEMAWIRRMGQKGVHTAGRRPEQMAKAVIESRQLKREFSRLSASRGVPEAVVRDAAQKMLANMAHDVHYHSAIQPIGYGLTKIFGQIFSRIWVNFGQLERIRELASNRAVPIVWLPTHKSYVDFLLLSLLSYHNGIQLPAICAAEDFQSSKLLGEALRRCGAFFIRRSFKEDPLYWALFREYIQQHLLHSDRPIEFFLEGQRSRTGKSVFPRNGLLQLCLEPFFRAQIYDILLVPVTINYDRILEEQLYANELLGQPKPRETASGLLKARQILAEYFGDIHVTVGQPISLRDCFGGGQLGKEDIRLELRLKNNESKMEEIMAREAQKLSLKIVQIQNGQNVLTPWPFMALSLLFHNANFHPLPTIKLDKLIGDVERLMGILTKFIPEKKIRRIGPSLEEEIRHFLGLHKKYIEFDEKMNEIKLPYGEGQNDPNSQMFINNILLTNYANPLINEFASISIFSIVQQKEADQQKREEDYCFLRTLLAREFVHEPTNIPNEFLRHNTRALCQNLDAFECEVFGQIIMQPFLISYFLVFTFLLEEEEKLLNGLSQAELMPKIQQKLIGIVVKSQQQQNAMKFPPQIVSMDLIKNALTFLKSQGAIIGKKEERQQGMKDRRTGKKEIQLECQKIQKVWWRLDKFVDGKKLLEFNEFRRSKI